MAPRARAEMIAETRAKLIAAARHAFGAVGYAEASMDDFTAAAGLTRGALYHHFGDKRGLLEAVVREIDAEMDSRLAAASQNPDNDIWSGFLSRCRAYLEMALDPEIQRIVLRDAPSVLGNPSTWPSQNQCTQSMAETLRQLMDTGIVKDADPEALARLLSGALLDTAMWIASAPDAQANLDKALHSLDVLLNGLRSPVSSESAVAPR